MALVIVGGASSERVETALRTFQAEGWAIARELGQWEEADGVLASRDPALLREADGLGIRYVLVHHGPDDGVPEGTYARAHHRAESSQLPELARRLRSRRCLLVTCLAFAYKNGIPDGSAWVVDVRLLENPYWVPELRPLTGLDGPVRDFVLRQPPALALLDGLEATLGPLLDEYRRRGRMELTIAFGCTGGRHRSVSMAREMAERLGRRQDVEVEFRARELGP